MLGFFRRRLLFKIGLVTLVAVACGFVGYSVFNSRRSGLALEDETRDSAQNLARGLIGGMQSAMVGGNGILVVDLIHDAKRDIPGVTIHVFDTRGAPVFEPRGPAPDPATLPAALRTAMATAARGDDHGLVHRPIPNEKRCHECHDAKAALRGVLAVELDEKRAEQQRDELLGIVLTDAFEQVMTAKKTDLLDGFFAELRDKIPTIKEIGIYDAGSALAFGTKPAQPSERWSKLLADAMRPGVRPSTVALDDEHLSVRIVPLPLEKRCVACHDEKEPVRGALVVKFAPLPEHGASAELEGVLDSSLRTIMMSALGRLVTHHLSVVAATHVTRQLRLYDADGRLYFDAHAIPTPPPGVAAALASGTLHTESDDEAVTVVQPLLNELRCQSCHGNDQPLRGAIEIRASTARATIARHDAMVSAVRFALLTMVIVFALLWFALKRIVVDPVRQLGELADQIGGGNLSAPDVRASDGGDEVARLGSRMNQMVRGLRAKLHLEKFVSKGTAEAAGAASHANVELTREGVRRRCTVLFTDIRGFTSYSERVEPEKVVSMLNHLLAAQAHVVEKYGGDIDKFVGDEVMAVFHGDDGPQRAVTCALEMIAAVDATRAGEETIAVGAGIAYGDVVYGAIGAEMRMDFTVIGDVVNTGARLCSRAAPSEILVSAPVRTHAGELAGVAFETVEPLALKGKRVPLETYRVTRR